MNSAQAHWAFGVRYFLVFDSGAAWTEPERSALWPAMAPFVAAGRGALLPWPSRACGARGDGPWVTLDAGEHDALEARGWRVVEWRSGGAGYMAAGADRTVSRERLWLSPHCLDATRQRSLFDAAVSR